ncbi:hypothetical protein F4802DRAFT_33478 [Xylaria palmicola]|nr:hypothetical protein F4802DRAFT_33478 [Xylaria palmicola]
MPGALPFPPFEITTSPSPIRRKRKDRDHDDDDDEEKKEGDHPLAPPPPKQPRLSSRLDLLSRERQDEPRSPAAPISTPGMKLLQDEERSDRIPPPDQVSNPTTHTSQPQTTSDDLFFRTPSPPRTPDGDETSWDSSLGEFLEAAAAAGRSLNSVRPPDPVTFCAGTPMPLYVAPIPGFLFRPRLPPTAVPAHILAYDFGRVLRRYGRLAQLVDDYQRWHGLSLFAFWTDAELRLAATAASGIPPPPPPALAAALFEDRPSVPPRLLHTRFDVALLAAPVLSHLIERFHNDLGYDYFAFYASDPRDLRDRDVDVNGDGDGDGDGDVAMSCDDDDDEEEEEEEEEKAVMMMEEW